MHTTHEKKKKRERGEGWVKEGSTTHDVFHHHHGWTYKKLYTAIIIIDGGEDFHFGLHCV
jgi:hypothetical protein